MAIVRDARKQWALQEHQEIWFRGEDIKYQASTLQPKLYRHLSKGVETVSNSLLREERNLQEEFVRCGTQLYEHDEVDEWDWYFLMQHHSAPTRLLDWSDGALMALHFAVNGDLDTTKGGYIYLLDPYWLLKELNLSPATAEIKKSWRAYRRYQRKKGRTWPRGWDEVYLPHMHALKDSKTSPSKREAAPKPELPIPPLLLEFPHITRRVAAQRSRFMVFGKDRNWLLNWGKKDQARLWRISISKSKIAAIKTQLRDAGVTESVIFPDLDGLGRELDQLWNSLKGKRRFQK